MILQLFNYFGNDLPGIHRNITIAIRAEQATCDKLVRNKLLCVLDLLKMASRNFHDIVSQSESKSYPQ